MTTIRAPKGYKLVKVDKPLNDGLKWWTTKGFKVVETNLTYKAKSGKTYPAVKGTTKDGKTLLLKAVRGGSVYTAQDF